MKLTVIGSGDAFHSGVRHQSCYLLEAPEGRILIDCGADALYALKKARIDLAVIDAVVISHCHGDHFGGLPYFFIDQLCSAHGTKPLEIFGPKDLKTRFFGVMDRLYPTLRRMDKAPQWRFHTLATKREFTWRAFTITPHKVNHFAGAGSSCFAFSFARKARRFAYSGDSAWCKGLIDAGQGANLFLIECTSYQTKYKGHLDYLTLAAKMDRIGAKRYLLTHMGQEMLASLSKVDAEKCAVAKDGLIVNV